ncbi:Kelch repeat-containing protein [Polaribacter uvawellassae]|uniref:Kelch repeat-containing protein n=1 Tax=Polaribacter uvawellassae TaxID=3133495 RepID=UPI00321BA0B4
MKKITLVFLLSFATSLIYGQTFVVKVLDSETNLPIAEVHLKFGKEVFLTNVDGLATISGITSTNLEASHIKYHSKFIQLKNRKDLTIYLTEKNLKLDEVTITSKRELKKYIQYTKLAELPKKIHSFGAVLIDDKLYTFGGDASDVQFSNQKGLSELTDSSDGSILKFLTKNKPSNFYKYREKVFFYDFKSKTWQTSSLEPKARAYHKAVAYKNEVYLLGGKQLTLSKMKEMLMPQIEVLNIKKDSIIIDEMNPHQGVNFEALVFEDKLLVIGGSTKLQENLLKKYTDKIHLYDFKTGYWYLLTTMSKGKETSGVILDKKLYLFGGNENRNLTEIESFNLITGKWEKEGELFTAMEKPAITKNKNTIYLFEKDLIVTYNTITKELKEFRIDLELYFSQIQYRNDKLYIIGGTKTKNYQNRPQRSFLEISLDEFENTRIKKVKTL